jgi:hypothetical protein
MKKPVVYSRSSSRVSLNRTILLFYLILTVLSLSLLISRHHPRLCHLHWARQAQDCHFARRCLRSQACRKNPLRESQKKKGRKAKWRSENWPLTFFPSLNRVSETRVFNSSQHQPLHLLSFFFTPSFFFTSLLSTYTPCCFQLSEIAATLNLRFHRTFFLFLSSKREWDTRIERLSQSFVFRVAAARRDRQFTTSYSEIDDSRETN